MNSDECRFKQMIIGVDPRSSAADYPFFATGYGPACATPVQAPVRQNKAIPTPLVL
jgi:hypothetical protein